MNIDQSHKTELQEIHLGPAQLMFIGGVVFAVIHFLWRLMSIISFAKNRDKIYAGKYPLDEKWTKKVREVTKNDKLMVRVNTEIESKTEADAFTPGANTIVYNEALLDLLNEKEVMAIMLHEFGHIMEKHTNQFFKMDTTYTFALHSLVIAIGAFGNPFAMIVIWGAEHILGARDLAHAMYELLTSKPHEYVADSYAAKFGYGKSLMSAFNKFEKIERERMCQTLSPKKCDRLIKKVYRWASHPSNEQRIKKLTKLIAGKYMNIKQKFTARDVVKTGKILKMFGKKDKMDKILGDEA